MRIREIDNYQDFLALKDIWTGFLQKCNHSVFSTWEWLSTWWKYFGNDKRLIVLLAQENDGTLIGIAPLMYSVHRLFGLRRGKIEFIGTPDTDYNDFIIAEREDECIKLFVNYLHNSSENWDCIDLKDIPENSKSLLFLNQLSTKLLKPIHKCHYIQLPKSYEILWASYNSNKRNNLRKKMRKLEINFKIEFVTASKDVSVLKEEMNTFFELHQKRWASRGYPGVFFNQRIRNFHLDIAESFSQKDWLSLLLLKLSGVTVAAKYGFKYMSKYYSYLAGFDPKYRRYGVGTVLLSQTLADCISEGITEFDLLRGAEEYKERWKTQIRLNYQVTLTRRSKIAQVQHFLFNEYWHQGDRLQYLLKKKQ